MRSGLLSETKHKNYLFVEGSDDMNVFIHLLNYHDISSRDRASKKLFKNKDEHFEIRPHNGFPDLLQKFKIEMKGDVANNRYGIVVDADTEIADRWKSLMGVLKDASYNSMPHIPDAGGIFIEQDGLPTIGIWLMPNNKLPGAIEEFISFLGLEDDVLWPIAKNALQEAMIVKCNFKPTYVTKAHLHTWLAWQEEPGTPMGQAITKKYVEAQASHALLLVNWFRKVFEL